MDRRLTLEDQQLVKDHTELPIVLGILNDNKDKAATFRLPEVFILYLDELMNQVHKDLVATRKAMRKNGIKVLEEEHQKEGIYVKYLCRGYTQEFRTLWGRLRATSEERLAGYLNVDITKIVRE